jgi:hypothetical protein
MDAHTVLASGGINAALGTLDPEDSWEQHFADTLSEVDHVRRLRRRSPDVGSRRKRLRTRVGSQVATFGSRDEPPDVSAPARLVNGTFLSRQSVARQRHHCAARVLDHVDGDRER